MTRTANPGCSLMPEQRETLLIPKYGVTSAGCSKSPAAPFGCSKVARVMEAQFDQTIETSLNQESRGQKVEQQTVPQVINFQRG